jgi:hypothetical protein
LTPTHFPDKNCLSSVGNNHNAFEENAHNDNCLNSEGLGKESNQLATVGTEKPTVGFEPTTTGLQNQSSTVELRWHKYCQNLHSNLFLDFYSLLLQAWLQRSCSLYYNYVTNYLAVVSETIFGKSVLIYFSYFTSKWVILQEY